MTTLPSTPAELEAHRIELDDEGYDEHGSYWGVGQPLYWVTTTDGRHDCFVRADDPPRALLAASEELPIQEAERILRAADADAVSEPIERPIAASRNALRADGTEDAGSAEPSRPTGQPVGKAPPGKAGPT